MFFVLYLTLVVYLKSAFFCSYKEYVFLELETNDFF